LDRIFRIDFYPQDWLIGTAALDPEEVGMYIQVCALIYAKRGPIENDTDELARKFRNCSKRKARALVDALVGKGKIFVIDGKLSQKRAENELNSKRTHLERAANGGRTKHENASRDKNIKDLASTEHAFPVATTTATANPYPKERKKPPTPKDDKAPPSGKLPVAPFGIIDQANPHNYKFNGYVIRLSDADFEAWRKMTQWTHDDLWKELDGRDDWYKNQPIHIQRKWFIATAKYLQKEAGIGEDQAGLFKN
jgi:uncharacterized protein YdaU (DUF1376 family)